MSIYLVDGCDNVGKSVFIDYIKKRLCAKVVKVAERPKDGSLREQDRIKSEHSTILRFIDQPDFRNDTYVLDRFFPSEIVYAKAKRGYDAEADGFYARLEKKLCSLPHIYVYCTADPETHRKRFEGRGDDYVSLDEIGKICSGYDEFFERAKMNKVRVDLGKPLEKNFLRVVAEFNKQNFSQGILGDGNER